MADGLVSCSEASLIQGDLQTKEALIQPGDVHLVGDRLKIGIDDSGGRFPQGADIDPVVRIDQIEVVGQAVGQAPGRRIAAAMVDVPEQV